MDGQKIASIFRTRNKTTNGDDAHCVVTFAGLDSCPENGRYFLDAYVPGIELCSGQGCEEGLDTSGFLFGVQEMIVSHTFTLIVSV